MKRERTEQTQMPKQNDALERALRAARPPVPPLRADFAAQVWAEVERQGIVPRPAWQVRGALWAGRAGAVALLALAVVTLNAAVYELRNNGALEVLYFGAQLLDGFLAAVPYDLVVATLLMGAGAAWLLRHARFARVPVAWALILTYGLTGTGGLTLAATGLNDLVRDTLLQEDAEAEGDGTTKPATAPQRVRGPLAGWVTDFFAERAVYHRPHARFRMGRVLSREGNVVRLESPRGEELEARVPEGFQARPGDHLRLIVDPGGDGESGAVLRADTVQQCAPGAQRYFHHLRMMRGRGMGPGHMGPGMGPGHMGPGMRGGMGPGHMGPGQMGSGMGMGSGRMGFGPVPPAPEADAGR